MRNAIALVLSLTPGLLAQRVAEQEPNDVVGNAQTLVFGQQVDCNLIAGEQDWFTFTMTGTGEVHVQTSGNFAVSPSVDTAVLLYDAAGTTRLAWNDGARGSMSDLGVTLSAGTYTVLVVGKTGATAGAYGLDFVMYPARVINTVESPEPNGDPTGGSNFPTLINLNDTFSGSLTLGDEDWFQFTLATDSVVQAYVYDDSTVPQLDNTLITLRTQTSPGVWGTLGTSSTISNSHRAFNLAHPGYLPAGTYCLSIAAGTAATGTAPLDYVKTGNYAVRTRMIAMPAFSTVAEAAEPNNTTAVTNILILGDSGTGNCGGSNEEDWWPFLVPAPTTVVLMSENSAILPTLTDSTIKLYDPNGVLITSASSGGATGTSHGKLVHTITSPGIYYVAVCGGVFAATGNYVLRTGGESPLLVPVAFQQLPPSTNACVGSTGLRPQLKPAQSEVAQLGTHFTMRLNNALPNAGVVSMLGFSNTVANPGIPLPLDLAAFGAPTCFLRVDPEQTSFGVADAGGFWFWDIPIPNVLAWAGIPFYVQVACFDATLNTFGISVSNDCKATLGDRGY